MHIGGMAVRILILLALVWSLAAPLALAGQDDARLDPLFARLKATGDTREGLRLTTHIWDIWLDYDGPVVATLMREGQDLMGQRHYRLALDRFDEIVRLAPDFAEGWNKRATVHYLMGQYEASVRDIHKTLALEPRHFGALSGLGLIYVAIGKGRAAMRAFEKAIEVNPHLPGVRRNLKSLRDEFGSEKI